MNLENFPTSPAAKRMLKTVSPIYDKSYVAKWIFQVMGLEIDEAWQFIEELRLQAFPETATWGIEYWEQRYHIAPDESLSLEERRQRVIIKRGKRSPMNPARIERIVRDVTGREDIVTEDNGTYTFHISILPGESTVDYQELINTVRSVKPSHLSFTVLFQTDISMKIQVDNQAHTFEYPLTGTIPDINTVGGIEHGSILPSISANGSVFDYQFCGEGERDL